MTRLRIHNLEKAPEKVKGTRRFLRTSGVGLAFLALVGSSSWAAPNLKPKWVEPPTSLEANGSFLRDLDKNMVLERDLNSLNAQLFDPNQIPEVKQVYYDITRDYEMRQNYGLVDQIREKAYNDQMSGLAHNMIDRVRDYQVKSNLRKMRKAAERDEYLRRMRKPFILVTSLSIFYTGAPYSWDITDGYRATFSANVRTKNGFVEFNTPYLSTNAEHKQDAPEHSDPYGPPPVDPTAHPERYKFAAWRGIPYVNVETRFTYGTTSKSVTATVSKQLTARLTGYVDTVHPLSPTDSDIKQMEERVRFTYGFSF